MQIDDNNSEKNSATEGTDQTELKDQIIAALKTVFDPEIPVSIYELGLIYDIELNDSAEVVIRMTLTAPGCPVAGTLPGEVEAKVRSIPAVKEAQVDLVWDPPWSMDLMSDAAKLKLGMFQQRDNRVRNL